MAGTQYTPSHLVFFSLGTDVMPPSGQRAHVRAIVGAVAGTGVVRDAEIIARLENRADVLVVVDHRVVVAALPTPACPTLSGLVYVYGGACRLLIQMKNGLPAAFWRWMKSTARAVMSLIDRLHALGGERAGVLCRTF